MIYGHVRVSTQDQSVDSQKNSISRYCIDQKIMVDEWIELEMSSRKSTAHRQIDELLNKLAPGICFRKALYSYCICSSNNKKISL